MINSCIKDNFNNFHFIANFSKLEKLSIAFLFDEEFLIPNQKKFVWYFCNDEKEKKTDSRGSVVFFSFSKKNKKWKM